MVHEPDMSQSPDTTSTLFPDRPIRPLPKRRLREKLSPEIAESIKYPPSAESSTAIFFPPFPVEEETFGSKDGQGSRSEPKAGEYGYEESQRHGAGWHARDSNRARSAMVARSPPDILNRAKEHARRSDQAAPTPKPPPSASSSADGYEAFENTNNKKKRKIPTTGDVSLNGAHVEIEAGTLYVPVGMSAEGHGDFPSPTSATYGSVNGVASNKGISGPGRGMFGRQRNGRSPLSPMCCANNWTGRNSKMRPPAEWTNQSDPAPTNIISTAIANAEKRGALQGQENVSLLQQHSTARPSSTATQFTFTCQSQVPGAHWQPDIGKAPPRYYVPDPNAGHYGASAVPESQDPPLSKPQRSASRQRRSRRNLDRELYEQARERQFKTLAENRRNPPRPEDIWMCYYCDYEAVFGEPPRSLIRAYEKKVRRERLEEVNMKRRLEQAKAKSRKGKKAAKKAKKAGTVSKPAQDHADHGHLPLAEDDPGPPTSDDAPLLDENHLSGRAPAAVAVPRIAKAVVSDGGGTSAAGRDRGSLSIIDNPSPKPLIAQKPIPASV